jgi:signal transduction histidine kinase/GAF domain-containing protein
VRARRESRAAAEDERRDEVNDPDLNARELPDLQLEQFLSLISADSMESILHELVRCTRSWVSAGRCALWWLDTNHVGFRLASAGGVGPKPAEADAAFLPYATAAELGLLAAGEPVELPDDCEHRLHAFDMASALAARIHYEDRTTGILVVFPDAPPHSWPDDARRRLRTIARHGAALCRNFERRERLTRLVGFLQDMSDATADYRLYEVVLGAGKSLLGCDRAVIRRVNLQNGHLDYVSSRPNVANGFPLGPGEGVTGLALQNRRTYRIGDVTADDWPEIYRPLWKNVPNLPTSRSELAVPILLRNARVHVGTSRGVVDKPFGVLNFESPTVSAFSKLDEECAEIIAQRMAPVMERIEFDKKLGKLRQATQALATMRDWDSIVDALLKGIRDTLGYEFVSLSIVEDSHIKCVRVIGLDEADKDEFRKKAVHDTDSDHVQAQVVRHQRTEVPPPDEPSLNAITSRFGLHRLIRVFVPMVVHSRNEVIGTISAGYDRTYREHIYQRDVQLLKVLVAFGTNAMEAWRRGTIDRVTHEMNAPLTAVRGNLSRLLRKRTSLSDDQIERALEDMETDTEVLYFQMQQLEYVLGVSVTEAIKQPLRIKPVLLFGDIIFKTINQLKPLVIERGLDPKRIVYELDDVYKVKPMNVDKGKISQVVFNLFMNAVKYAESPKTFQIRIGAAEQHRNYVIKFCDWGIGIPDGLGEKIFQERFRAREARERNIMGSGLGLTISRQLMKEHGGDLVLKKFRKPTEFHMIIPKHIGEAP